MKSKNKFGISQKSFDLILTELQKYPEIEEVKVFGSRAVGNYKTGSDIDISIKFKYDSDEVNQIFNSIQKKLIDHPLIPYKIDILNYYKINNPKLKKHIDEFGKELLKNDFTLE